MFIMIMASQFKAESSWQHNQLLIITIMLFIFGYNLNHHHGFTVHHNHDKNDIDHPHHPYDDDHQGTADDGFPVYDQLLIMMIRSSWSSSNHLDHPHDDQGAAGNGFLVLDHLLSSCLLCTSLGRIWPQLVIVTIFHHHSISSIISLRSF